MMDKRLLYLRNDIDPYRTATRILYALFAAIFATFSAEFSSGKAVKSVGGRVYFPNTTIDDRLKLVVTASACR